MYCKERVVIFLQLPFAHREHFNGASLPQAAHTSFTFLGDVAISKRVLDKASKEWYQGYCVWK